MNKTMDYALAIKAAPDESGVFEGYGSVFGNIDSYGEKVAPGAFSPSLVRWKREGSMPLMLWQHDSYQPIGVWEDMAEDGKGLYVKGRLLTQVTKGAEALALLKAGAVRGLSIGFRTLDSERDDATGVVTLKEIDLFEVSIVSFPANRRARVDQVKASDRLSTFARQLRDGEPPQIKEFEDILRDAGVPKSMAVRIASVGYAKAVRGEPEGEKANDLAEFARLMRVCG